jgi:hypothetical protein
MRHTMIKKIFITLCALSLLTLLKAKEPTYKYTDKTFLAQRPFGVATFQQQAVADHLSRWPRPTSNGITLAANLIVQNTCECAATSAYFLTNKKSSITIERNAEAHDNENSVINPTSDVELDYLIHTNNTGEDYLLSLDLEPERSMTGVRFDCHYNLGWITPGLYATVAVPFVAINASPNSIVIGKPKDAIGELNFSIDSSVVGQDTSIALVLADYLKGVFQNDSPIVAGAGLNRQERLQAATMSPGQQLVGFADIDCTLGYTWHESKLMTSRFNLGMTIPTGKASTGQTLFEPLLGNGNHFAVGFGTETVLDVWHNHRRNKTLHGYAKTNYRYLFSQIAHRTLGITGKPLGHYYLLGDVTAPAGSPLIPAANLLTQRVYVTPRHQLDSVMGIVYSFYDCAFDFGIGTYYRSQERMRLCDRWENDRYAIAARNFETDVPFGGATKDIAGAQIGIPRNASFEANSYQPSIDGGAGALNLDALNLDAARTPQQASYVFYGNFQFLYTKNNFPMQFHLGCSYEAASDNATISQWSVSFKSSIGF